MNMDNNNNMEKQKPKEELIKLFERDNFMVAVFKEGEWVDHGRGLLRIWKRTSESESKCWVSLISKGTKRELLATHQFGTSIVDNKVVLSDSDTFYDPTLHDDGVMISAHGRLFLFKSLGATKREEKDILEEKEEHEKKDETVEFKKSYKTMVASQILEILSKHAKSKTLDKGEAILQTAPVE